MFWSLCLWGIYPIIVDDVVCKVNFQKLIWRPNINGYMQLCLCLWALSGPEVGIYSSTEDVLCRVNFKNDLEAKQSWIYAVLLLSVGPVGPGGGIYSIIDYVVCKVYFLMDQVDHVICWPSENLTIDILTKWEVEQLGTWPRTSRPHPWDIYPWALSLKGSLSGIWGVPKMHHIW